MEPVSPEVATAMQRALRHERMVLSSLHDLGLTHCHQCNDELQGYFDKKEGESFARRHSLINRLLMTDQAPDPNAEEGEPAPVDESLSLIHALDMFDGLHSLYQDLYAVSTAALDVDAIKLSGDAVSCLEDTISKLERNLDKMSPDRVSQRAWEEFEAE